MNARRSSGRDCEDLVELALPDDDVHLTADTGVAQQLLDIHQTATAAVDFVFTGAVAEHPTRDRHLGVLDRQRVVGVVDGDGDLGATQRGPRRRAGEDDVFHLAAAQRFGALLPHHPGQRVDHVGLARPVGSDDGGDAGLKPQSRRRGEGLETLQRQTLEVHGVPDYRSVKPLIGSPRGDQSTTTLSTWPGVFPPCNTRNSCSHASREPCATTCTRPSGRLAAYPVKPSSSARERVHQRKPTPCTRPVHPSREPDVRLRHRLPRR